MLSPRRTTIVAALGLVVASVGVAAATGGAALPGVAAYLATHAVGGDTSDSTA